MYDRCKHYKKKSSSAETSLLSYHFGQIYPLHITAFHKQGPGNLSIYLLGQKILAATFVMKPVREHSKMLKTQQTDRHGQTELNNMLVTKSLLNEINKEQTF